MSTPLNDVEFTKEIKLQPQWNSTKALIVTADRDPASTDPDHNFVIPPGVWMIRVSHDSRFIVTPTLIRNGRELAQKTISASATGYLEITTESQSEMYLALSLVPNTNDQAAARFGVTMVRTAGYSLTM